jgi:hypothetical protein
MYLIMQNHQKLTLHFSDVTLTDVDKGVSYWSIRSQVCIVFDLSENKFYFLFHSAHIYMTIHQFYF